MRKHVMIRLVAFAMAAGIVDGCAANPRPKVGVEYAMRQPPRDRVEMIPAPPGTGYVWVKGHWGWRRNDYEWVPGHWAVPERGRRDWVPGRWEHDRHGWYYVEGHWR